MSWRLDERGRRRLIRWLGAVVPWVLLALGLVYVVAPLVTAEGRILAGAISGDNVISPWFYDLVARQLEAGVDTDRMTGLRWPKPLPRIDEFPSDWDARLLAPLAWWLGWPAQWGASQAVAVVVNALGAAVLARGLGATGLGLTAAGLLGALCRPVWKDFVMGRMNSAFPGLAFLALGLWLLSLRSSNKGPRAWIAAMGAVAAGWAATLVYPPYVALLVPIGVVAGVAPVWRAGWAARLRAVGVVALVAWLTLDPLLEIAAEGTSRQVSSCDALGCPNRYGRSTVDWLWRTTADFQTGLSDAGAVHAGWLLAPLVLLSKRYRAGLAIAGIGVLYVVLSLGPCPTYDGVRSVDIDALPFGWGPWLHYAWCVIQPIHDYNRLLAVAVLLAASLGGVGVASVSRRGWLGAVLGVGLSAWATSYVYTVVMTEALRPEKWQTVMPQTTVAHQRTLEESERGPVLELPFDRSAQFLSVLEDPSVPRGNPLRPSDPPPRQDRFWRWAYAVGRGQDTDAVPTLAEVQGSGIAWVYFDADRCGNAPTQACGRSTITRLGAVLGQPKRVGGLLVWKLRP